MSMDTKVIATFRLPVELDIALRLEAAKRRATKTKIVLDLLAHGLQHIEQENTGNGNSKKTEL